MVCLALRILRARWNLIHFALFYPLPRLWPSQDVNILFGKMVSSPNSFLVDIQALLRSGFASEH